MTRKITSKRILTYAAGAVVAADVSLLLSGYRILVREQRVTEVIVKGSVSYGIIYEPIVDEYRTCTYFTGRSLRTSRAPSSFDECPFASRPER